jgi:hypothetical protein
MRERARGGERGREGEREIVSNWFHTQFKHMF